MIQITRPSPGPPRYSDPEEVLAGRCATCKTVVSCVRRDARMPSSKPEPGAWHDVPSAECPACGARAFVMKAEDFRKAASRENLGW